MCFSLSVKFENRAMKWVSERRRHNMQGNDLRQVTQPVPTQWLTASLHGHSHLQEDSSQRFMVDNSLCLLNYTKLWHIIFWIIEQLRFSRFFYFLRRDHYSSMPWTDQTAKLGHTVSSVSSQWYSHKAAREQSWWYRHVSWGPLGVERLTVSGSDWLTYVLDAHGSHWSQIFRWSFGVQSKRLFLLPRSVLPKQCLLASLKFMFPCFPLLSCQF